MAVIPEMVFSPEALAAIREVALEVTKSFLMTPKGQAMLREEAEKARAEHAAGKDTASHRTPRTHNSRRRVL